MDLAGKQSAWFLARENVSIGDVSPIACEMMQFLARMEFLLGRIRSNTNDVILPFRPRIQRCGHVHPSLALVTRGSGVELPCCHSKSGYLLASNERHQNIALVADERRATDEATEDGDDSGGDGASGVIVAAAGQAARGSWSGFSPRAGNSGGATRTSFVVGCDESLGQTRGFGRDAYRIQCTDKGNQNANHSMDTTDSWRPDHVGGGSRGP